MRVIQEREGGESEKVNEKRKKLKSEWNWSSDDAFTRIKYNKNKQ